MLVPKESMRLISAREEVGKDSGKKPVDTHGLTPVALAKKVCIYLEGCMPSNSV
jgi:hypothetical protein